MTRLNVTVTWKDGKSFQKLYRGLIFNFVAIQIFNEIRKLDTDKIAKIVIERV